MTATATAHVTSTVESEVSRIRMLLKERRFAESVAAATTLGVQVPENRDVLYLLALGQRQLIRTADALATLDRLENFHPGYSRLYQERGHCYVAMKDAPRAIQAFLQAVAINPALPATWGMLEGLYRMSGDADNAATAAAHVAKLKTLPQEVIAATGLFSDGDVLAAEKIIRAFLLANGDHIEAMRLLARIGAALEVFDDAEVLLEAVLERVPNYVAARHDYAAVLLGRHKYSQALAELDKLLAVDPPNRQYRTLKAAAMVGLGEHAQAVTWCTRICCATRCRDHPMPPICTCRSPTRSKRWDAGPMQSASIGRRPASVRISEMPTGVSPTSRPTVLRMQSWRR